MDIEELIKRPLLPFRPELKLFPGPDEPTGAPTFNLFDPIRGKYFKISWEQSLLFEFWRPGHTAETLAAQISRDTSVKLQPKDVILFYDTMERFGLLARAKESEAIETEAKATKQNPFMWLVLNYLFLRIPLFNPDRFLTQTLHYVRPFASFFAFLLYLFIAVTALILLIPRLGEYTHTFTYYFTIEGFLMMGVAFLFVKTIHELSHAYTAKYYGIYVPTIGIAFILLWPTFYTDVTHGWQIKNRHHRFAISAAGVIAELVLAGFATWGWLLTKTGALHSTFFLLSSVTLLRSLFMNLNPAFRFDGYYLLCDLTGIDNLMTRSFNVTRWKLRQWLWGIYVPSPESQLTTKRLFWMMVYTLVVWTWRLFLYTAIAFWVYFTFTKTLGIILFLIEILVFFIWPVYWEIQELYRHRKAVTINPRLLTTLSILIVFLLFVTLPLPHTIQFPGRSSAYEEVTLFSPAPAEIIEMPVTRGQLLKKGALIVHLRSYSLENKIQEKQVEIRRLQKEAELYAIIEKYRTYLGQKNQELASAKADLQSLMELQEQLTLFAPWDGQLVEWNPDLKIGTFLEKRADLGKMARTGPSKVIFFVPEENIAAISLQQNVLFILRSPRETFPGVVTKIDASRTKEAIYPELSSTKGGALLVNQPQQEQKKEKKVEREKEELVESYYRVEATLPADAEVRFGQTGEVEVTGPFRSLLMDLFRKVSRVILRESGT